MCVLYTYVRHNLCKACICKPDLASCFLGHVIDVQSKSTWDDDTRI